MFNVRAKFAYEDLDEEVRLLQSRSSVNPFKFFLIILACTGLSLLLGCLIFHSYSYFTHGSQRYGTCPKEQPTEEVLQRLGATADEVNGTTVAEKIIVSLADYRQLEGKRMKSRAGRDYLAFLGIPYAIPPVGKLRFQPPLDPEPWNGTLDAREFRPWCIQKWSRNSNETTPTVGSEDCLYLNIFTPKTLEEIGTNVTQGRFRRQKQLPVMVYVHGGGATGNVNRYGADYLLDEDIILITFHYRLGVIGNLNTNDVNARGNQGLKDNVMAFKWIQNNIASFGGDHNKVTLFGESYGAMSISAHLISPMSKGLFQRAILQSGSVIMPGILQTKTLENALELGAKLNCTNSNKNNTEEMINCLQNVDAETIVLQSYEAPFGGDTFTMSPEPTDIDEDVVLVGTPLNLLSNSSNMNPMPLMMGVTSAELVAMSMTFRPLNLAVILMYPQLLEQHNANLTQLLIQELKLNTAKDPEQLAIAIQDFYIGSTTTTITNATERNLTYMFSDRSFVHPATVIASFQLQGNNASASAASGSGRGRGTRGQGRGRRGASSENNVYLYQFNYPADTGYGTMLTGQFQTNYSLGVEHADDLQFLFPYGKFPYISAEHKDANFSRMMVHLWASFADTGIPDTGSNTSIEWRPITSQKPYNWYELDMDPRMIVDENGLMDRMNFWDSLDLNDLYL